MVWSLFVYVDSVLKFPNLKKGEIGIQVGFDMYSPVTSDLFTMYRRVGSSGKIYGIDPDPYNHEHAQKIINEENYNIELLEVATYSKPGVLKLLLGEQSSWNQLDSIPKDTTVSITEKHIKVNVDTLDHIVEEQKIVKADISHISLTINGSEYHTLLGMKEILTNSENLSLTVVAGRYDESGEIEGKKDYEMIIPLLESYGFKIRFKRINELFWWGFVANGILNKKWVYNKPNYGIIMAGKGSKKLKWYQSFS